ncbi:cytochrome c oxidase subunit II [Cereibacter sp. SYSU M97828]|nr:cytochrome c oxidase subunit II [Cereibacter flavus]
MKMRPLTSVYGFAVGLAATFAGGAAIAQGLEVVGRPTPGATGFQPAATELARDLQGLDHMLLIIIGVITVFVTALLIWCILRFNTRANKTPATFTHNSPLEIAWTIVPILILVFIGAFSLPVLFKQQEIPEAELTIKATGNQWYWSYEYVDDEIAFDSFMIGGETKVRSAEIDAQLVEAGYEPSDFLLATDTAVIVPVNTTVVVQVTASDVIHSWAMPAFGVKQDGVPGRLAELWFSAEREGVYFGQCSELCGKDHAYMPITVKVVSQEVYAEWLAAAKAEGGYVPLPTEVASNGAPLTVAAN